MEKNPLYPIFLKTDQLKILVVGGGEVAEEKLHFLLKSSPDSNVKMVATFYREKTVKLADQFNIERAEKAFDLNDLEGVNIVIAATNYHDVNLNVYQTAKEKGLLVNVADTPNLCDFYMGSIVTKGTVKIAISTNGKSPTLAKRMRQFFEEAIPEDVDELANYLDQYRHTLKGNFEEKVKELNKATQSLIN